MAAEYRIRATAQNALSLVQPPDINNVPTLGPLQVQINNFGILNHSGQGWSNVANINMAYITQVKIQIFDNSDAIGNPVYDSPPKDSPIQVLGDDGHRALFIYDAQTNASNFSPDIVAMFLLSFDIPPGTLKTNTTYYWRALPAEREIGFNSTWRKITNDGTTFKFQEWTATSQFITTPAPNDLSIAFLHSNKEPVTALKPLTTADTSGFLIWDGGKEATTVSLDSVPYIPILPKGNVDITNTDGIPLTLSTATTFTINVVSDTLGKYSKSTTVAVPEQQIVIDWKSSSPIPKTQLAQVENFVAQSGETYPVTIYTEYMKSVGIYLYYPLPASLVTPESNTEKILAIPGILLQDTDLNDNANTPVAITIAPPVQNNVSAQYFISGAWGWEGIGKDKVLQNHVVGYFKFLNNS